MGYKVEGGGDSFSRERDWCGIGKRWRLLQENTRGGTCEVL